MYDGTWTTLRSRLLGPQVLLISAKLHSKPSAQCTSKVKLGVKDETCTVPSHVDVVHQCFHLRRGHTYSLFRTHCFWFLQLRGRICYGSELNLLPGTTCLYRQITTFIDPSGWFNSRKIDTSQEDIPLWIKETIINLIHPASHRIHYNIVLGWITWSCRVGHIRVIHRTNVFNSDPLPETYPTNHIYILTSLLLSSGREAYSPSICRRDVSEIFQ